MDIIKTSVFVADLHKFSLWLIEQDVKSKADLKRKFKSSGLKQNEAVRYYKLLTLLDEVHRGI
jgi:hypothetical protein